MSLINGIHLLTSREIPYASNTRPLVRAKARPDSLKQKGHPGIPLQIPLECLRSSGRSSMLLRIRASRAKDINPQLRTSFFFPKWHATSPRTSTFTKALPAYWTPVSKEDGLVVSDHKLSSPKISVNIFLLEEKGWSLIFQKASYDLPNVFQNGSFMLEQACLLPVSTVYFFYLQQTDVGIPLPSFQDIWTQVSCPSILVLCPSSHPILSWQVALKVRCGGW